MLHLPTLLALSFVTCGIVTGLLLLTRATLGRIAAGAVSWVVGDLLFQLARLLTLAERHAEWLPGALAQWWPRTPDTVMPGALLLAAIVCHHIALRRAEGVVVSLRRRAAHVGLVAAAWVVLALQFDDPESRIRLLAAALVLALLPVALSALRLGRRYWGARLILAMAGVALVSNAARVAGFMVEPASADSGALSALFMMNIVASLTVTLGFMVMLQEQVRQHMLELSITDPLTGLLNRRGVLQALERDLQRTGRAEAPLSVVLFDLDHFKRINDTHGHQAGDGVLAAFAACLRAQCRRGDLVARWGGEEFMVAMPGTTANAAVGVAERVRGALRAHVWPFGQARVTVSAGVAQRGHTGSDTVDALIERADQCLYRAKDGRDRVCADNAPASPPACAADAATSPAPSLPRAAQAA